MEQLKRYTRNKGGRPKKVVKKDQFLAVKCTLVQRSAIEAKAKAANTTISDYLRQAGLGGKIGSSKKAIPKEVLQLTGMLNHLAANLNQIAKKRNGMEPLDALERARLEQQSRELKGLTETIKNYLK